MKVTVDIEHLGEVSTFIKTCDEHWRGVLVAALGITVLGAVMAGMYLLLHR